MCSTLLASGMQRLRRAALPQALTSASRCHIRGLNRRDTKNAEIGKQGASEFSVLSVTSGVNGSGIKRKGKKRQSA